MQKPASPIAPDELPRWTIDRMRTFIETLRRTRNVAGAARAAGMSRQAAYALRARLPGHPFDRAWAAAMAPTKAFRQMTRDYPRVQATVPPAATSSAAPPAAPQGMTPHDTGRQGMTAGDTR